MVGIAALLVLGSGFLHAVWNLYTKRSLDKNAFLWFCQLIAIVVFLPWAVMEWDTNGLTIWGSGLILVSMLLHGVYMLLLAAAYSVGDLSQVYPIMRGTSPILIPFIGVFLLDEHLSLWGWCGVCAILIGILLLSRPSGKGKALSVKAPFLALMVGLCITSYIVIDKLALEYVPAVVLNEATNVGNVLALSWAAFRSGGMRQELRLNWKIMLLGGVLAPGGYLLFLYALSLAPVAQLAPMREIGTVFGTIMGVLILREQQGRRRLTASVLITAGVIILGLW
ncbi:DMT family transporter [Paenibacillus sp. HB172176]|uniref:DMT family transporter n=1 Tax=Paenibacillus sp. HB172176 TaxID=2493690 RepID=UPI001438CD38|nr:DMT family transporter [Paenibacillus sp. HB172176]